MPMPPWQAHDFILPPNYVLPQWAMDLQKWLLNESINAQWAGVQAMNAVARNLQENVIRLLGEEIALRMLADLADEARRMRENKEQEAKRSFTDNVHEGDFVDPPVLDEERPQLPRLLPAKTKAHAPKPPPTVDNVTTERSWVDFYQNRSEEPNGDQGPPTVIMMENYRKHTGVSREVTNKLLLREAQIGTQNLREGDPHHLDERIAAFEVKMEHMRAIIEPWPPAGLIQAKAPPSSHRSATYSWPEM